MDDIEKGKLIVSAAKSLKGFQLGDSSIASFLYATSDAGRLGLFVSAIRSESNSGINRIRFLAGQEGINFHSLTSELLPWLEKVGLCGLQRKANGEIVEVSSLVLAYQDLLSSVSEFYESRNPSAEDRACLLVLSEANALPQLESSIRQEVARTHGEEVAQKALQLAKVYSMVDSLGNNGDQLIYAPRVWSGLEANAHTALSPLDRTDREVLNHLVDRVRHSQGYPENLFRKEAADNGVTRLVDLAIGIGLVNKTELTMSGGAIRSFLTTPHFYSDLADEFGEDMCDRVKIFLDSIRNGQYFGIAYTGRIRDPQVLLRALIDRGRVGPATAIGTDYIVAEKAGIIRVEREPSSGRAFLNLGQADTVQKVLEIVTSGTIDPSSSRMNSDQISGGSSFSSIEQGRAELGGVSRQVAEIQYEIMRNLREG